MPVGYGKKIRHAVRAAARKASAHYRCPKCSRPAVRRVSAAVWQCRKCDTKFSSGTYEFKQRS